MASNSKDHTKFLFNGEVYGKGRLVLAVVTDYVSRNPDVTFDKLKSIFPDLLHGSQGVFSERQVIKERFAGKSNSHHFMKPEEIISLDDADITVCVDWTVSNIYKFIDAAKSLGMSVELIS